MQQISLVSVKIMEITRDAIATHLRMFRHLCGLSPEQAAARTKSVSSSYVRRLEKGLNSPTLDTLVELLAAYDTTPAKFFSSMAISNGNSRKEKTCALP